MQHITNPKTIRGKLRRAQANLDASFFIASKGFNACATKAIVYDKLRGANHKKLRMESKPKTYKPFSAT
jgi:hypothetical protein